MKNLLKNLNKKFNEIGTYTSSAHYYYKMYTAALIYTGVFTGAVYHKNPLVKLYLTVTALFGLVLGHFYVLTRFVTKKVAKRVEEKEEYVKCKAFMMFWTAGNVLIGIGGLAIFYGRMLSIEHIPITLLFCLMTSLLFAIQVLPYIPSCHIRYENHKYAVRVGLLIHFALFIIGGILMFTTSSLLELTAALLFHLIYFCFFVSGPVEMWIIWKNGLVLGKKNMGDDTIQLVVEEQQGENLEMAEMGHDNSGLMVDISLEDENDL